MYMWHSLVYNLVRPNTTTVPSDPNMFGLWFKEYYSVKKKYHVGESKIESLLLTRVTEVLTF
jgi:hypothetical protein